MPVNGTRKSISNGYPKNGSWVEEKNFEEIYINKAFEDTEHIEDALGTIEKSNNKKNGKLQNTEEKELSPVPFFELFRYSSACDKILIAVAFLVAVASSVAVPSTMIIFGKILDKLIQYDKFKSNSTNTTISKEEFLYDTKWLCIWNSVIGAGLVVCKYIYISFLNIAAANQAYRIRCLFMSSVLKQDIGWYDTHKTGEFASRITGDLSRIQEGIGEKVGMCTHLITTTLLAIGVGLCYGWKLCLVTISIMPLIAIAVSVMSKIQASISREELKAYGSAGAVAEEVFSSIRTVCAFGGEEKEIERYDNYLIPAQQKGIKRGLWSGIGYAVSWFSIFACYSVGFWYGIHLILEGIGHPHPEYTGGTLLIVFFNVILASLYIGQTAPYFETFAIAKGAAIKIFSIIERKPNIDSSSNGGLKPESLTGVISFKNVCFNYPARTNVKVLNDLSLEVHPGKTVALVGPSGCGKSTIVQLILRFYDTISGKVMVDGIDVKSLNVGWLRDHIGLVGQEPVLFSTTIAENIKYGKLDATQEEIEAAAKIANAHSFVDLLPMKYNTLVGERGVQLSGGQKQRIAIARALIKNPRILLLDEATSALDTESEAEVQAALDQARKGRTTVVVAHRLSTIKNADQIIVLSGGNVKETGTHNELMQRKEIYYQLVNTQINPDEDEIHGIDADQYHSSIKIRTVHEEYGDISNEYSHRRQSTSTMPLFQQISNQLHRHSIISAYEFHSSLIGSYGLQVLPDADPEETEFNDGNEEKVSPFQSRLLKISTPEWTYALIGGICAILMGLHFPTFGVLFGSILGVLSSNDTEQIREQSNFLCLIFIFMAMTAFVFSFLQVFMFAVAGERLTSRLRKMVFTNIITQDMQFFDEPKNSVGALCSRLSADVSCVSEATGSKISTLLQSFSTIVCCIIIALWYNLKLGAVALAIIPFLLVAAYFQRRIAAGETLSEKSGTEAASKVAVEAIENIRTVASLHQEKNFFEQFKEALLKPHRISQKMSHIKGIIYGLAEGLQAFSYAAIMYYGSILVADGQLRYPVLLKILEGVLVGVTMVGQAVAMTADYQKAKLAAARIFKLLDLTPTIHPFTDGKILNEFKGEIKFEKVHFNYPSRPNERTLRGLNLDIKPGKTVALVGSSGCGKSTCVQLIERFYDPLHGDVFMDNENVKNIKVSHLRSHVGLVSQEPVLFSRSIAENIAYGDNSRNVEMTEIIEAARQANIHNFIASLPAGYDTPVGDKGTQLSGGQKQRVAIARALLRNPKILLLDEATSALDAESEKLVQEALDQASNGRTCIIIAHRLSTIQNADTIAVIKRGHIVEKGTHQELLSLKGHYYNLHNTGSR